jgi:cyclase
MTKTTPHIRVHHHNDYLISFYAGRDQSERHLKERNWLDDSALKLGTAMYAIHSGAEAVVYDTFASVAHAEFVRSYLEQLGIRKFTAVLSHWHLDHIAGNAVFDDGDIIATSLTRDALLRQGRHRSGQGLGDAAHRAADIAQHRVRQPPGAPRGRN